MTDADRLREVLPRLHAKGIAKKLNYITPAGYFSLWGRSEPDDIAITYAIGAIVEVLFSVGWNIDLSEVRSSAPTPIGQLIQHAANAGLIAPLEPTP